MTWFIAPRLWRPLRSTTAVLLFSGAVTVGLMLLAGFVLLLARDDVTREADKDALNVARSAGQDIARNLELYDLRLRTVAREIQNPGVQALPVALRQAVLFDGVARDEHVGFINVLDEHGAVIADSASLVPRGGHWAGRDYFLAQRSSSRDALFIGEPFDKVGHAWSMVPLSRRLTHVDGSFAGVVVGSVRLDYFAEVFGRFAVGAHGTIMLLLDNGMILQRMPAAPTEIGHIPTPNPFRAVAARTPVTLVDPVDRRPRRFVLYRPDGLPLTVAVGLAPADIYAAWNRRAATLLAALLTLGLVHAVLLRRLHTAAARQTADARELDTRDVKLREQAGELKQIAQQHAVAVKAEKQAHRDRARQLDDLSHDMRTRLHGALARIDLIPRKGPLSSEQADHLAAASNDLGHLRDLAERFLRDAREQSALSLEPTDIRELLGMCRSMVSLAAENNNLELVFEADPDLPERVVTDRRRLAVILSNLLDNAIKHTTVGLVALHASLGRPGLCFVITDTGCGMPPAQSQRLLDGVDEAEEALGTARGRGLSIVRRNVEALGGSINCLSNPGGGTIISLIVPATPAVAPCPPARPVHESAQSILVVDDSAISRKPTAELLRANGYNVEEASSGEAGVQLVSDGEFDIVLLDGRMAGISGPETARRIRALPGWRGSIPIVVLSATSQRDGLPLWQHVHISGYVEKSHDLSELLQTVRQATATPAMGYPMACKPAAIRADDDQLDSFAQDLLITRDLLDAAMSEADAEMIADTVHRTGGDARQLGFTALAAECRRYEQAYVAGMDASSTRACLIRAANDVLAELLQRRQEPRNGELRSATPTT